MFLNISVVPTINDDSEFIVLSPALIVQEDEIDKIIETIREGIQANS